MPRQNPAAAEAHGGEHLLARMTDGVAQHHIAAEPLAHLRQVRTEAFVKAQRNIERFELAPEWLVGRIVSAADVHGVGAEEDGLESALSHESACLRDRALQVE